MVTVHISLKTHLRTRQARCVLRQCLHKTRNHTHIQSTHTHIIDSHIRLTRVHASHR
jgi:hypothetical protein